MNSKLRGGNRLIWLYFQDNLLVISLVLTICRVKRQALSICRCVNALLYMALASVAARLLSRSADPRLKPENPPWSSVDKACRHEAQRRLSAGSFLSAMTVQMCSERWARSTYRAFVCLPAAAWFCSDCPSCLDDSDGLGLECVWHSSPMKTLRGFATDVLCQQSQRTQNQQALKIQLY